jgi:hypothetical protein
MEEATIIEGGFVRRILFSLLCACVVLFSASLSAQEITPDSHKGKEHHRKAGGTQIGTDVRKASGGSTLMGDGSVRFNKQSTVTAQSSGTGAGKVTIKSGITDGTSNTKTIKTASKPIARHPAGANPK